MYIINKWLVGTSMIDMSQVRILIFAFWLCVRDIFLQIGCQLLSFLLCTTHIPCIKSYFDIWLVHSACGTCSLMGFNGDKLMTCTKVCNAFAHKSFFNPTIVSYIVWLISSLHCFVLVYMEEFIGDISLSQTSTS